MIDYVDMIHDFEENKDSFTKIADGADRVVYESEKYPGLVLKVSTWRINRSQNRTEVFNYLSIPLFDLSEDSHHEDEVQKQLEFVEAYQEYFNPILDWSEDFKYIIVPKCLNLQEVDATNENDLYTSLQDKICKFIDSLFDNEDASDDFDIHDYNVGLLPETQEMKIIDYGLGYFL